MGGGDGCEPKNVFFRIPLGIRKQDSLNTACLWSKHKTPQSGVQTHLAQAFGFGISPCQSPTWARGSLGGSEMYLPHPTPHPYSNFYPQNTSLTTPLLTESYLPKAAQNHSCKFFDAPLVEKWGSVSSPPGSSVGL